MLKNSFLSVSLLLICVVALGVPVAQAAPVGTFLQVEGRVDILKGGKLPATAVKVQDAVDVGDVVRTKSMSRAQIKFVDDTVLTMAPESRVTIEKYMFDGAKGERQAVLEVLRGLVHTAVEKVYPKTEPDFIMKTHTAVLGVRGTRWYTKLLPNGTDVYTEGSKLEVKSIFPEIPGVQVLGDLQVNFPANPLSCFRKEVQGGVHYTLGGILDGHHTVMEFPLLHFAEDLLDGGHGAEAGGVAEFLQGRQVGEGGLWTQEGHPQGGLNFPSRGDDFPKDVPDGFLGQGPGVQVKEMGHHLLLPPEVQSANPFLVFDLADGLGHGLTPVEEV